MRLALRPLRSAAIAAVLASPLSGCRAYTPGEVFKLPSVATDARTIGCLDIAAHALRDPVVEFTIGNRCPRPVGVDFRNLAVRAWSSPDEEFQSVPSDPRSELFEAVLDGESSAKVTIYFPVPKETPAFCVDIGKLNVDTPTTEPREICFEEDVSWVAVAPSIAARHRRKRDRPPGPEADLPEVQR